MFSLRWYDGNSHCFWVHMTHCKQIFGLYASPLLRLFKRNEFIILLRVKLSLCVSKKTTQKQSILTKTKLKEQLSPTCWDYPDTLSDWTRTSVFQSMKTTSTHSESACKESKRVLRMRTSPSFSSIAFRRSSSFYMKLAKKIVAR